MKKIEDLIEIKGLFCLKDTTSPYTGLVDGEAKGAFKNGLPDGDWEEYSDTGTLLSKTNYKNGVLEGEFLNFFNEGQLKEKDIWLGKLQGELLEYYKTES